MTALRLAIVGVGDVAQRDYLPEFHRLAGRAEIVAVCGVHADRAKDVAARLGVPRWSTDYRATVEAGDVDAVVNLTPIPVHPEITLAALRAGRHVYTEKPLASSLERCLADCSTRPSEAKRARVRAVDHAVSATQPACARSSPPERWARS